MDTCGSGNAAVKDPGGKLAVISRESENIKRFEQQIISPKSSRPVITTQLSILGNILTASAEEMKEGIRHLAFPVLS